MPFSNTIDVIELLGADVLKVLEYSVTDYDESTRDGKFLQISGLNLVNVKGREGGSVSE